MSETKIKHHTGSRDSIQTVISTVTVFLLFLYVTDIRIILSNLKFKLLKIIHTISILLTKHQNARLLRCLQFTSRNVQKTGPRIKS